MPRPLQLCGKMWVLVWMISQGQQAQRDPDTIYSHAQGCQLSMRPILWPKAQQGSKEQGMNKDLTRAGEQGYLEYHRRA